ncbi:TIGR04255 family protein [Colwellia sp. Arc7-D]|uniref:TIGR04255 family protein n=1 Tax=Colwellia sp. Arc7-D TaxID=2161872 RepID=UPI000D3A8E39|nr:TIGR04255 family protein [Colwellia sp. Arc7-D]AWB56860.1 hypothetical protein DBO93_04300 [Colwellia sp. Arc7-D]
MGLVYSLAVISVAEIAANKLNTMNEEVHELLREKYPLKMEDLAKNVSVQIDEDNKVNSITKTSPVFTFISADRNDAIMIACEQITFHTKKEHGTDYIVNELKYVFSKIATILEIKHVGNVAIRNIHNFSLNDDGVSFNGFNATNLLAPTINSMPQKGPSVFECHYVKQKNILRLKTSVEMSTSILPNELMDSAIKHLKISSDIINILVRIDIDTIYNCDGTFRLFNIDEIVSNFTEIGNQADTVYAEIQKGV